MANPWVEGGVNSPKEGADPRQNSQRVASRVRLLVRSSNLLLRPHYRFVD